MELKFKGSMSEGNVALPQIVEIINSIRDNFTDGNFEIVIRKKKKIRSLSQNAYYWGVVVPMIREGLKNTGEQLTLKKTDEWLVDYLRAGDKTQTHKFLKEKFLDSIDEETGEIKNEEPSTANLRPLEFAVFIDQCIQFAAQHLHMIIPPPGSQTKINY